MSPAGSLIVDPGTNELLDRLETLAAGRFAPRARDYDRSGCFPKEDFDDLHHAGLLAAPIPRQHGGLGFGPQAGQTFPLWMMTKGLAKADLSLARCWEGHTNSLVLIDALGTPDQKQRWFDGVVGAGDVWVAWSGEPQAPKPGEARRFGTTVTRVDGGWTVDGSKAFATSATGARWAILLVDTAGPGGARHSTAGPDGLLLLACELGDPTITVDGSWWDPLGMRATASHVVHFDGTFIPETNLLGAPGSYLRDGWQTAFIPHYAASFLGAAEAAYDYAVTYLKHQRKTEDPYVRQRVGSMAVNVATGSLWLRHVADLWDQQRRPEAELAGSQARHLIEHLAEETIHHCIRACGARALVRPSPVERILRDLTVYLRHDNDDHIRANIGRAVLDEDHDLSFYKP